MSKLISIVVPAFNADAYLDRCVRSILGQSHANLEVIVVNDCSSDGTRDLLAALKQEDPRVRPLNLEKNVGVHAARARGIEASTGAFIGFVDADDWVDPGMFAGLYDELEMEDGDIAICGAELTPGPGEGGRPKVRFRKRAVFNEAILEKFCNLRFGSGVLWNKLYRRRVIETHGTIELERFLDASEDYIVNIGCFAEARKVVVVPGMPYFYYENRISASRTTTAANGFSRVFRAYVASLEQYKATLRADLNLIGRLYRRQLRLSSYQVPDSAQLDPVSDELRESLRRMIDVYPEGLFDLINPPAKEKQGLTRAVYDVLREQLR